MKHLLSSLERQYQYWRKNRNSVKYEHICLSAIRRKAQKVPPSASFTVLQSEKRHKKPLSCRKCAKKHHFEADSDARRRSEFPPTRREYNEGGVPPMLIKSRELKDTDLRFPLHKLHFRWFSPMRLLYKGSIIIRNQFNEIASYRRRLPGELTTHDSSQDHHLPSPFLSMPIIQSNTTDSHSQHTLQCHPYILFLQARHTERRTYISLVQRHATDPHYKNALLSTLSRNDGKN
jgi:hypothetical protein